jgi:hypothetical protein
MPDGPVPLPDPICGPISPVQPAATTHAATVHNAALLVLSTKGTLGDARAAAFPCAPIDFRSTFVGYTFETLGSSRISTIAILKNSKQSVIDDS